MKITIVGLDVVCVTDTDYINNKSYKHKIHLVKLDFSDPTSAKMEWVIKTFKDTNRFIVSDNISFYNSYLKHTNKKYYVLNTEINKLVSFYKKNNKVLLDTTKLSEFERIFVFNVILDDILSCTEVMVISKDDYNYYTNKLNKWSGNLIILEYGESL
jgi:hypothetical protein